MTLQSVIQDLATKARTVIPEADLHDLRTSPKNEHFGWALVIRNELIYPDAKLCAWMCSNAAYVEARKPVDADMISNAVVAELRKMKPLDEYQTPKAIALSVVTITSTVSASDYRKLLDELMVVEREAAAWRALATIYRVRRGGTSICEADEAFDALTEQLK